jgi:hypothetical protein
MTEEQRAQLLAEWLKSPPGTDPPEGLDPEVVAAVWALSPERAPRPRTTLDDILGSVKEGPFAIAQQTTGEVVEFPRRAAPPAPPIEERAPARRPRRPSRWMMPVLGGFLAAAAAAAIVIPVAGNLKGKPDVASTEVARMERPPATIPEAAPPPPPPEEPPAAPKAEASAPDADAAPEAAVAPTGDALSDAPARPTELAKDMSASSTRRDDLGADEEIAQTGERQTGMPPEEPADKEQEEGALGAVGTATGGGGSSGYGSGPGAMPQQQAPAATAPAPPAPAVAEMDEMADDEDRAQAATPAREEKARAKKSAESYESTGRSAGGRVPPTSAPAPRKGDVSTDVRAGATPLDYDADWYAAYPDVSSKYVTARMQEQNGAWAEAAAIYESLVSDSRLQVAQDAAYRAARAWRNAGDASRALRVTDEGLRRSGANTPFRAQLLSLRGDLLDQLGRSGEAERAWQEAAELNSQR